MKSSLEWQVAEMCFLERMRVRSAVLMLDWEMIKELTFWTETGECSLAEPGHCKSLQDRAEFLSAPKKGDGRAPALSKSSVDRREGWVSG
jgi:hypothetical protein